MNSKPVTVIALLRSLPEKQEAVASELLALIEPSRKDEGCLNYDLHRSTEDPTLFMFHENWTRKKDLDDHLAKPDLQAVLNRVVPMLAEPPKIQLYEKIG